LEFRFCSICGKPHIVEEHFISLTRRTSCGNVSIPVCLDDPTNMRCLIAALGQKEEQAIGHDTPFEYDDLASTLAKWILANGAFLRTHPMNGVVQEMITGMVGIESEDLAFNLMWWRSAPFSTVPSKTTLLKLIEDCGWSMSDDEYRKVLDRCLQFAVQRQLTGQKNVFERCLQTLGEVEVHGWASELAAARG
jgi:hypothetical protein